MFVAFLTAVFAGAQPSVGPEFITVLAAARIDADCVPLGGASGCSSRPTAPEFDLSNAMASAHWRIRTPSTYIAAFRSSLGKYLTEQRARRIVDPSLKAADYHRFQIALNVLPSYYGCLERHLRAAPDAAFTTNRTIDNLADEADVECAEPKRVALQRIGYDGPDFHGFNPMADGGKPGSDTAEMLMHIEQFAISYNAALRGAPWRKAIATVVIPGATPLR